MEKAEIIIYKEEANQFDFQIEVRVEDDTVWLTQMQMAELFQTSRNNITLHVGNIFKEGELEQVSICKDFLLTAIDGKKYKTKFYNLDVIISVGYRVKLIRGTQFRPDSYRDGPIRLKDFLFRGYAINNRLEKIEKKLLEHGQNLNSSLIQDLNLHKASSSMARYSMRGSSFHN